MENIATSFNAVMPMFIIIMLGSLLRQKGWIHNGTQVQLNKLGFQVFMPILVINNIYHMDFYVAFQAKLLVFAAISIILMWLLISGFVMLIEKTPAKRGSVIQGMYRSNYTLFGLTILTNLFGHNNLGIPSLLVAIVIPVFNVLAVVTLETFRGGKVGIGKIGIEVAKNPFIMAVGIGLASSLLRVTFPVFLESTLSGLSAMAMPMALIAMGASLSFERVFQDKRNLSIIVIGKLIAVPLIFVPCSVFLGFRGIELASLMVVFASPTGVASYPMAHQMNSDAELTSAAIILTTIVSCFTMFVWIFVLKQLGLI